MADQLPVRLGVDFDLNPGENPNGLWCELLFNSCSCLKRGGLQVKHLNTYSTYQSKWVQSHGFCITVDYFYSYTIPICRSICEFNANPKRVSLILFYGYYPLQDRRLRDMPDQK